MCKRNIEIESTIYLILHCEISMELWDFKVASIQNFGTLKLKGFCSDTILVPFKALLYFKKESLTIFWLRSSFLSFLFLVPHGQY